MRADRQGWARPGAALAVVVLSAVVVSDQRYVIGEGRVVDAVNELPRWLGAPLELVMPVGTLGAGLLLTAVVAVVALHWRPTAAVLAAAFVSWRADNVLKDLVERQRPPAILHSDITLRDSEATGFGFPSGHTTTAFALAAVLHPLLPRRWRWVPWAVAVAVGVARMYVGAHFPMDVLGGAALGVAIGGAASLLLLGRYRPRPR
jgi:membrane-associated phospholipid phosphatase